MHRKNHKAPRLESENLLSRRNNSKHWWTRALHCWKNKWSVHWEWAAN